MCSPRTVLVTQILVRETLFLLLLLWDGAQIQITMVLQAEHQSVEPYWERGWWTWLPPIPFWLPGWPSWFNAFICMWGLSCSLYNEKFFHLLWAVNMPILKQYTLLFSVILIFCALCLCHNKLYSRDIQLAVVHKATSSEHYRFRGQTFQLFSLC